MQGAQTVEPTVGAIARMLDGSASPATLQPFLQVHDMKALEGRNPADRRWRLLLGDGQNVTKAVANLNSLQEGSTVTVDTVLHVKNWSNTTVQGRSFLAVIDTQLAGMAAPHMRGNWTSLRLLPASDMLTQQPASTQQETPQPLQAQPQNQYSMQAPAAYTTPEKRHPSDRSVTPAPVSFASRKDSLLGGYADQKEPHSGGLANTAANLYSSNLAAVPDAGATGYGGVPQTSPGARPQGAGNPYGAGFGGAPAGGYGGAPQGGFGGNPYGASTSPYSGSTAPSHAGGAPARSGGIQDFFGSRAVAPASQAGDAGCLPISELTPYANTRWKIKARVTMKSDIRKFNNARGEGQFFKVELRDKTGEEISGTFFGRACDKFYDVVRQGQVYYISKGAIKMANKKFDRGDHVIMFEDSTIIEAADDDVEIPGAKYNFKPISEVNASEVGAMLDVKAVVVEAREAVTIISKRTNKEQTKREMVLWDESGPGGSFIEATLWGDCALQEYKAGAVVYARSARVTEWNGTKQLSFSGAPEQNPDAPEAFALCRKFEELQPQAPSFRSGGGGGGGVAAKKTIQEMHEENLNLGPPPMPGQSFEPGGPRGVYRHSVRATVLYVPGDRPPYYMSCPATLDSAASTTQQDRVRQCRKKVQQEGDAWRCAAGHVSAQPQARYLCRATVSDHSGSTEVSLFDDVGRQMFGCEADDLARRWDDPSGDGAAELMKRPSWKRVNMNVRSQKEVWQDEERVKSVAEGASAVNLVAESRQMLADVHKALATMPS